MAAISASRSWARRALTTTAVTAVSLLALAIPASAHKPAASAACKDNVPTVTVTAVAYEVKPDNKTPNWIKIFVDGSDKAAKEFNFGVNFPNKENPDKDIPFGDLDPTVEHTFQVDIKAWNAEFSDEKDSWSRHFPPMKTPACKKKDTPPPNNPPANPPANPPVVNPAPQPAPAPAVSNAGLADTGVSIGVPLAIGGVLLVGGAGLLLLMRRRGKA